MLLDVKTKSLLYDGPEAAVILAGVPSVRVNQYAAVRITLGNLQALAALGITTPNPLEAYDWPCKPGEKPLWTQRISAGFLALNPRAFDLSEMRTGKTRSSLWAADFIMSLNPGWKTLVVCNLSTTRRTWGKEIFENFIGRRKAVVLHARSMDARRRLLNEDADFYIVNHDGVGVGATIGRRGLALRGFAEALFSRKDIKIAVLDEVGAYRAATTRRSKIARRLFDSYDYVWALTGTPTPNAPTDAHGLKKLVDPGYTGSFTGLRDKTMYPVTTIKWERKEGANEIVRRLLSPAIRWRQEDCFDAPAQTVEGREVGLSPSQRRMLAELKREYSIQLQDDTISAANEAALRMKLFQICGGAVYDEQHKSHSVDASPRLKVLHEILMEAPKKVLIFSPLTNMIKMIYEWLQKQGFSACLINGETPPKERNQLLSGFQALDGPRVLVAHPGPIARGLDLTSAATIVWFTPTDRTEDYIQANQRINGPQQNRHRHIIQLSATAAEREVYRRLDNNESLQGALLKLVENER